MLGYAKDPGIWRDDLVDLSSDDELLPALAEAFSRLALAAVEQGLLQGYRTVQETLPVLRGRMLAGEQMTRLYGLPVPLAVEYDDFTVDIPENQLLLMALRRLLVVPRISVPARRRLQRPCCCRLSRPPPPGSWRVPDDPRHRRSARAGAGDGGGGRG
jgi:5-methylcytosine-specific restriction enzyme subunit McrC